MSSKYTNIKFPLWDYLNQPLFSRDTELILNPYEFARVWRIQLLERCWCKHLDTKGQQHS